MTMLNIESNVHHQLSDFTTPVNVLLAIREKFPLSLLLESSDYQSKENSFSFIGFKPIATASVENGVFRTSFNEADQLDLVDERLSDKMQEFIGKFNLLSEDPVVKQYNGIFGYSTFETVRYFDSYNLDADKKNKQIPDLQYHFFAYLIVFDHYNSRLTIIENLVADEESNLDKII